MAKDRQDTTDKGLFSRLGGCYGGGGYGYPPSYGCPQGGGYGCPPTGYALPPPAGYPGYPPVAFPYAASSHHCHSGYGHGGHGYEMHHFGHGGHGYGHGHYGYGHHGMFKHGKHRKHGLFHGKFKKWK